MKNLTPLRVYRDTNGRPMQAFIYERGGGTAFMFELMGSDAMLFNAMHVEAMLLADGAIVPDEDAIEAQI